MSNTVFHVPVIRTGPAPTGADPADTGRADISVTVDEPHSAAVRSFCTARNLAVDDLVRAALCVLVYRFTGRDPVARSGGTGRSARIAVRGSTTAADVIDRVAAASLAARPASIAPAADFGHTDRAVDNALDISADFTSARAVYRAGFRETALRREDAKGILARVHGLVAQMLADPLTPVADVAVLSDEEIGQQHGWNSDTVRYEWNSCVHDLIAERAKRAPGAVAVAANGTEHTYAELISRSEAFAAELRASAVGPGRIVGLYADRTFTMLTALLGILRAGAGYLPLDPVYPADRLAFMAQDSGADVLVVSDRLLCELPADLAHGRKILIPENVGASMAAPLPQRPPSSTLAYVIYTSGSTGRPKATMVSHRSVVNLYAGIRDRIGIEPDDIVLAPNSLSFDISILDLLVPLLAGARVHLVDRVVATDGKALARELMRSGASRMHATPATYRLMLASGWRGDPGLTLLVGGEALPPDLARTLLGACGELWNMYGPTETTVLSHASRVAAGDPITIGSPMPNVRSFVLDSDLNPLPAGVMGELYIAGAGVTYGYHGRPALTAGVFLPDPFGDSPGARMYKTGDLVSWTADGRLAYHGRLDGQVKLNGYRIEVGEIEAALRGHPAVTDAVVALVRAARGDPGLVAYLTVGDSAPTRAEIRGFLADLLPDFMIPARFLVLDSLPLTPSKKVDRSGIAALTGRAVPLAERRRVDACDGVERVVLEVWRDLLAEPELGVTDALFEYGVTSLVAQAAAGALREVLGVPVPIRFIFDEPTVAGQARWLKARLPDPAPLEGVPPSYTGRA